MRNTIVGFMLAVVLGLFGASAYFTFETYKRAQATFVFLAEPIFTDASGKQFTRADVLASIAKQATAKPEAPKE